MSPLSYFIQFTLFCQSSFYTTISQHILGTIAHNVPAVYDVFAVAGNRRFPATAKMWRRKTAQRPQADCGFS
jgi:hypothetical protein